MKTLGLGRRSPGAGGQSLVEFALFLPILVVLMLAIGELARVYSTMIAVESAAREAADWGALKPGNWDVPSLQYTTTVADMKKRACTPTRGLTEYAGAADGTTCTNPGFVCELYLPASGTWVDCALPSTCALPEHIGPSAIPCKVRVTLTYTYVLIAPTELLGLPSSFTFVQTSVFNVADDRSTL